MAVKQSWGKKGVERGFQGWNVCAADSFETGRKQSVRNFCMACIFDRVKLISILDYRFALQMIIVYNPTDKEFIYFMINCGIILWLWGKFWTTWHPGRSRTFPMIFIFILCDLGESISPPWWWYFLPHLSSLICLLLILFAWNFFSSDWIMQLHV